VRSWRRQQNAAIRTCLTLWMHKRQALETKIKVMAEARRKLLKRRSWREWVGLVVVRGSPAPIQRCKSCEIVIRFGTARQKMVLE
jgi:hypothetical protein